jgi:hypothetical protein
MAEKNGRPISIYAAAGMAKQAEAVAVAENRKIGQLGGEALAFWVSLPAAARAAFRFIDGLGTEAELEQARRDVTRALVVAQRGVASARASREIREQFENLEGMDEEDAEQLAVDLSKEPAAKGGSGEHRRPPRTSSDPRSSRRSRTRKS